MAVRDTTIPSEMRAVRCHGKLDYRVERVPVASLQELELLIRVERCGLCAGDAKCYNGAAAFWGDASRPVYVQPPIIPGCGTKRLRAFRDAPRNAY
eukprot:IDg16296t1